MKYLGVTLSLICSLAMAMDKTAYTEADAIKAVTLGMCGDLPLGRGLKDGKGWLHQPDKGEVIVRLSGPGTIKRLHGNPSREVTLSMVPGLMEPIEVQAPSNSKLEWKTPNRQWGPVPLGFQIPSE